MPVCTFIKPCNWNLGGGYFAQYGVGQYFFDHGRPITG